MAKLTDKTALTIPALDDLLHIVDTSDTTSSAEGTSKKIELQYIPSAIAAEIKTAYEGNAETNAYTDDEKTVVGNTSGTNTGDQVIVGKQTISIPAGALTARTTSGAAPGAVETTTNKVMLSTLDFDNTADEFAQFMVQMPKSWNAGTVTAKFVWSHPATTTNFGVAWALQGLALTDDDAADAAFGTAVLVTDVGGTTDDFYLTAESAAITIANTPAKSDFIVFQVYRDVSDAGDTLAVDARLHNVQVIYTTDSATDD